MRKLHTHEASPLDATGTIFTGAKIHTVDDNTAGAESVPGVRKPLCRGGNTRGNAAPRRVG